jgi:hypothetical protein
LVVILDCALVLAYAHEHGAAVVEGLRAVRVEPHRLSCIGERAV